MSKRCVIMTMKTKHEFRRARIAVKRQKFASGGDEGLAFVEEMDKAESAVMRLPAYTATPMAQRRQ